MWRWNHASNSLFELKFSNIFHRKKTSVLKIKTDFKWFTHSLANAFLGNRNIYFSKKKITEKCREKNGKKTDYESIREISKAHYVIIFFHHSHLESMFIQINIYLSLIRTKSGAFGLAHVQNKVTLYRIESIQCIHSMKDREKYLTRRILIIDFVRLLFRLHDNFSGTQSTAYYDVCVYSYIRNEKKRDIDDHFETDRLRQALKLYIKKPENGGMKKSRLQRKEHASFACLCWEQLKCSHIYLSRSSIV